MCITNPVIYCFIIKIMSDIILPHGAQADGSMVDVYGNRLSKDEVFQIIEQVA